MRQRGGKAAGFVALLSLLVAGCGGGESNVSSQPVQNPAAGRVYVDPPTSAVLTAADVQTVVAQAVAEAKARGVAGTIAVTDRVGNVLAVYQMAGAAATVAIPAAPDGSARDAQGLAVPATVAAIAKAITGAYLSSAGNAFSTRTASQIVQEHFPPSPGAGPLPGGPLFGVQFSQLPCSDLNWRLSQSATLGPKRSPLGLAADPGGFPLYKAVAGQGSFVVGGVGVITDGQYGFDADSVAADPDTLNADEYAALAGTRGFQPPDDIRADHISVGVNLAYADASYDRLQFAVAADLATSGSFVAVGGYYPGGGALAGTAYGAPGSGYRRAAEVGGLSAFAADPLADAYVLTDGAEGNRFAPRPASDGGASPLTASEVSAILEEAFKVLRRQRAAIRHPIGSRSQVTISIVDRQGNVLGLVRSPDAPVFGTDVSLQKARTAAFFSSADAAATLSAGGFGGFVTAAQSFFARSDAFAGWGFAFGDRSIGSIARPLFPDGQPGTMNGPFSYPIAQFNPFATGLQSALIVGNLATELTNPAAQGATCSFTPRLGNGLQIFPGSVPIYRGDVLVGGIGVSGDGVTQDDMIGYLGLNNAAARLGNGIGNAPLSIRSNRLSPPAAGGAFLQYVICPAGAFVDSNEANVCPDVPNE